MTTDYKALRKEAQAKNKRVFATSKIQNGKDAIASAIASGKAYFQCNNCKRNGKEKHCIYLIGCHLLPKALQAEFKINPAQVKESESNAEKMLAKEVKEDGKPINWFRPTIKPQDWDFLKLLVEKNLQESGKFSINSPDAPKWIDEHITCYLETKTK